MTSPKPEAGPYDMSSAIMAYEDDMLNDDEVVELFQHLIDTGLAWQLQGSYGRMANRLIADGLCDYGAGADSL